MTTPDNRPDPNAETYRVFAIRYATLRRDPHHFVLEPHPEVIDPHEGGRVIDYFVWVIVGRGRIVMVDTGFNEEAANKRKRNFLGCPAAALERLGLSAERVDEVVVTHLHYDHAGNLDRFPNARFHVQRSEVAFATGPDMRHPVCRAPFEPQDVCHLVTYNFAERVRFLHGDGEIAPGIGAHLAGGHTAGMQAVSVETARGKLILASDVAHFFDQMVWRNPFPVVVNIPATLAAYERMRELAQVRDERGEIHDRPDLVIPGHDPLVQQLYPTVAEETIELSAEPLGESPLARVWRL